MKKKIAIIGLGYVGLPLAVAFSKKRNVLGFDLSIKRIDELKQGYDKTNEVLSKDLKKNKNITFVSDIEKIRVSNTYIIAVPTPIKKNKKPDLKNIIDATKLVSSVLSKGDIIIYESTVYPGLTEEICVPVIEKNTNFKFNKDFYCGYSPERANPGDKKHTVDKIVKITSGSTPKIANIVDQLYSEIIKAGTFKVSSIKVAEAAKVIENTQRDLNIALMNELSLIFNQLNIDTDEVLKAASTKWNFINFKPGLVGGHCIGVDPYYLTYKSENAGYSPKIILAGRNINENMPKYICKRFVRALSKRTNNKNRKKILILGATFKENCPDLRNSKVYDIFSYLKKKQLQVDIHDPIAVPKEMDGIYESHFIKNLRNSFYDGILLAVAHKEYIKLGAKNILKFGTKNCIFYDIKSSFHKNYSDFRL